MTRRRALVDTSAWIETLPQWRSRGPRVGAGRDPRGRAVLCDLVLLELWNGAQGADEHRILRELELTVEKVPTSPAIWEVACELARMCRKAGITAPATDILIAACAEHHKLEILHRDAHFDQIARVRGQDTD